MNSPQAHFIHCPKGHEGARDRGPWGRAEPFGRPGGPCHG